MKNKIRELRKREGLTQQALASAVGCNTRQIQKFENGECDLANMTLGMAFRISAALCVDVYDLIDRKIERRCRKMLTACLMNSPRITMSSQKVKDGKVRTAPNGTVLFLRIA